MSLIFRSVVLALLVLSTNDRAAVAKDQPLAQRLEQAVKSGEPTIDLRSLTDFQWDRLYRFPPYSSRETIEQSLGFAWPEAEQSQVAAIPSNLVLLVFTKQQSVVQWLDFPEGAGDFSF